MPILTPIKTTIINNYEEFCKEFNFNYNDEDYTEHWDTVAELITVSLATLPQNFIVTNMYSNTIPYFIINEYQLN